MQQLTSSSEQPRVCGTQAHIFLIYPSMKETPKDTAQQYMLDNHKWPQAQNKTHQIKAQVCIHYSKIDLSV